MTRFEVRIHKVKGEAGDLPEPLPFIIPEVLFLHGGQHYNALLRAFAIEALWDSDWCPQSVAWRVYSNGIPLGVGED